MRFRSLMCTPIYVKQGVPPAAIRVTAKTGKKCRRTNLWGADPSTLVFDHGASSHSVKRLVPALPHRLSAMFHMSHLQY